LEASAPGREEEAARGGTAGTNRSPPVGEREVIEPCGRLASAGSPLCGGGLIRPCPARPLPGTRSGSSESKGVRDDGAPRRVCSLVLAGGVFPDLTANAPP